MSNQLSFFNTHIPPLAERMRPKKLSEIVGQEHLVGTNQIFRLAVEADNFGNIIFWGPPGTGKTTIAKVIAQTTKRSFLSINAAFTGIKEVKKIIEDAKQKIKFGDKNTILFVDEIHRFNKAQQDAFLHPLEMGTIILIGATTENPSFEINSALLSRCNVYTLNHLKDNHIEQIIKKSISDSELGLAKFKPQITDAAKITLINYANGDARVALNSLEIAIHTTKPEKNSIRILTKEIIKKVLSTRRISLDKKGEEHYNLISALHKSLRGSDPQAGLYWLARMLEGGADPLYIARRLIRFATEDIGLADPQAIIQAIATKEAVHFIGYPECDTALAQCTIYLATAPKSNATYVAINKAKKEVMQYRNEPVPLHIRNAPTKLMKNLNYGKDYKYDHNEKNSYSDQSFLPKSLGHPQYYKPGQYGFEKEIKKRIDYWNSLKK